MKDLKENIQKNNMIILAISAVLGIFCYCTNNAMKKKIDIDDVLTTIVESQIKINEAKEAIKPYEKKICYQMNKGKKIKKGDVIDFINSKFLISVTTTVDDYLEDIKIFEQYFHLETKKKEDECTKDNLTEIFWENLETIHEEDKKEIDAGGVQKIKTYVQTIIDAEKAISEDFKTYYEAKKEAKKEEAHEDAKYEDILEEIKKDCCCTDDPGSTVTKFLKILGQLCLDKSLDNVGEKITVKIKRRITLFNDTAKEEEDFMYFLKQKIGEEKVEEKKKENNTGSVAGSEKSSNKPAVDDGCSCCKDCCKKKG